MIGLSGQAMRSPMIRLRVAAESLLGGGRRLLRHPRSSPGRVVVDSRGPPSNRPTTTKKKRRHRDGAATARRRQAAEGKGRDVLAFRGGLGRFRLAGGGRRARSPGQPPRGNRGPRETRKGRRGTARPRGAEGVSRGADARRAGQGRQAAAGQGPPAGRATRRQAAERDRQIRRHLAARLHRPRRRRERQPHHRLGQASLLGRERQQDRAERRQVDRYERRREDVHHSSAQGHEVVGRRALHRRRFHLLVRGHLQQQGHRADADCRHVGQRQARPPRQDRRDDGAVPVRRPLLPVLRHAGRRHADRRRPIGAPVADLYLRRILAGALPEAVPAEIFVRGGSQQAG